MVPELGNYFSGLERANDVTWGNAFGGELRNPRDAKKFPDAGRGNFIADRGKGMG